MKILDFCALMVSLLLMILFLLPWLALSGIANILNCLPRFSLTHWIVTLMTRSWNLQYMTLTIFLLLLTMIIIVVIRSTLTNQHGFKLRLAVLRLTFSIHL
ncbi:hypothetical protein GLOIN_2v1515803 [Rhizophagus irregularis DAOM 181602=DAOM 197198]|uniref:Uncharacterized protein n=1 Tax=Rhizophagus irregularis (strain DAOM 181602 / DAOM 197198 / MUCL 43194) TaxID=747089 RepID=A0A2P4QSB4_RHIID|nr:hypothetical protein GLOIN_2v1515803 [Rhizophagus irregularis DAOM 181602=DAOM 197198]POG80502.1 hypothetical protein GLOIN_2v1515803 [Rhizophagus irregularis DAOM 181602=DAOM 197198]|eukprot:XP_025187368.1 hypothetical protein GLOIN_2v1515803 [Rhizophagus irregularis DAOM 181602=DAOM 197198]